MLRLTLILLALVPASLVAEDSEQPLLTSLEMLIRFAATEVFEHGCPPNTQCQIRCSAGTGQERFEYGNVKRFEMAPGATSLILVAAYMDPVGKGHRATGVLPNPASCILDDLVLERVSPLSDGELFRPPKDEEVIFEFRAQ